MKIRSNKKLIFSSERNIRGIVEREVIGFYQRKRYQSDIINVESRCNGVLRSSEYSYDFQKVDSLFKSIGDSIDTTESFNGELEKLCTIALHQITGSEGVFLREDGTPATIEDWEMVNE